jgi:hypothetical protein
MHRVFASESGWDGEKEGEVWKLADAVAAGIAEYGGGCGAVLESPVAEKPSVEIEEVSLTGARVKTV